MRKCLLHNVSTPVPVSPFLFIPSQVDFFFFYYQWGKRGSVRFHWSNIMGLGPLEINFIFFVEDVEECAVLVNKIDITVVNLFRNAQPPPLADFVLFEKTSVIQNLPKSLFRSIGRDFCRKGKTHDDIFSSQFNQIFFPLIFFHS